MAKGYWIGRIEVTDLDTYKKYVAANAAPFAEYGAKFLTRGGAYEAVEGEARSRNVVIEFPTYEAALDCYQSDGYQKAKAIRVPASMGELVIVEGYEE